MPKTNKQFDWEVYDKSGNFLDILSMTRDEEKKYSKTHPNFKLQEIEYNDRGDGSRDPDSKKGRDLYSVRVSKRLRGL